MDIVYPFPYNSILYDFIFDLSLTIMRELDLFFRIDEDVVLQFIVGTS